MPTAFDSLIASSTATDMLKRFSHLNELQRALDNINSVGKRLSDAFPLRELLSPPTATGQSFAEMERSIKQDFEQRDLLKLFTRADQLAKAEPYVPILPMRKRSPAELAVKRIDAGLVKARAANSVTVDLLFLLADGSILVVDSLRTDGPDFVAVTGTSGLDQRTVRLAVTTLQYEYSARPSRDSRGIGFTADK